MTRWEIWALPGGRASPGHIVDPVQPMMQPAIMTHHLTAAHTEQATVCQIHEHVTEHDEFYFDIGVPSAGLRDCAHLHA